MTVVNFSFTKLLAEKKKVAKGKIDIKNNISIKDVSEAKMAIDAKRTALKFNFLYEATYEPEVGKINLGGEVIYVLDKKVADDVMKMWKKDKKVKADFMTNLMNHILAKSNIQAVIMSRDINLPAPIPLPKIKG